MQRFTLRWHKHQSNLLTGLEQILHDESFADVTLAAEGQFMRAHKIILASCSPYFQALFESHPDKHPIVILKDVSYVTLKSLLQFMYRGEVAMEQDRLDTFIRVGESLKIKGLTDEKDDDKGRSQQNQQNLTPQERLNQLNMLNRALMQPNQKRKRGRPRKLSGSSNGTPGADDFDGADALVQGSPEMLEVRMGMDNFSGNNSDNTNALGAKDIKEEKMDDDEPMPGPSRENHSTPTHSKENSVDDKDSDVSTQNQNQTNSDISIAGQTETTINNNNHVIKIENTTTAQNESFTTPSLPATPSESTKASVKRRVRRRTASNNSDPAEQLTEMSVRGLNLFRYASISDGVYQCNECAKADIQKTFKNKYSFQRHAFLYHEGHQRKVFPCPVCQKEFSRPDKMKNHLKTVHDCFVPKDCLLPMGFFMPPQ